MKKYIYPAIALIVIFVISFTAFKYFNSSDSTNSSNNTNTTTDTTTNTSTSAEPTEPAHSISEYFPIKADVKATFEGVGNEYASFTSNIDFIQDNKVQIRTDNGGTQTVKVLENSNGELKIIYKIEDSYYRENFLIKASNTSEILLKEPLVKGTSWSLSDGRKRYISNTNVDISTPSGNYKALEITTESQDKSSITYDYYALNTGLVKSLFKSGSTEVSSSLKALENNGAFTQNVRFYYPDVDKEQLLYTSKTLSFKTNAITKSIIETEIKQLPSQSTGKVLGPNAKIKTLYLGDDGIIYIDFSKEFITEMNAGSAYESMVLQAIVNTVGNYYQKDKVYLTIENEPYASGHILMEKGETFKVTTTQITELKK